MRKRREDWLLTQKGLSNVTSLVTLSIGDKLTRPLSWRWLRHPRIALSDLSLKPHPPTYALDSLYSIFTSKLFSTVMRRPHFFFCYNFITIYSRHRVVGDEVIDPYELTNFTLQFITYHVSLVDCNVIVISMI